MLIAIIVAIVLIAVGIYFIRGALDPPTANIGLALMLIGVAIGAVALVLRLFAAMGA